MTGVENHMANLSIRVGEDDGVQTDLEDALLPHSFDYCFTYVRAKSNLIFSGQSIHSGKVTADSLVSSHILVPPTLENPEVRTENDSHVGSHVGQLGLGPTYVSPNDGFDIMMGQMGEDDLLGDSETSKCPRT
ncbi:hypothetical protein V6N13_106710 [Hibiscus sabdariffa]